jgi:hypothetical protein
MDRGRRGIKGVTEKNLEILSSMGKKIRLLLSEKERAKYERFKSRNSFPLGDTIFVSKNHSPTSKSKKRFKDTVQLCAYENSKQDEPVITSAFEILIEGMRKGNEKDKIAAEALMGTIKYKNVSQKFVNACECVYNNAIISYENARQKMKDFIQIVNNPNADNNDNNDNTLNDIAHAKSTHRIMLPKLPE